MKAQVRKHASKFRFALVGGFNTALDFGILFLLVALGVDKFVGNYISTSITFLFSFFANKKFTFKSTESAKKQFLPFLVVTLLGLWVLQPIVIALVMWMLGSLHLDSNLVLFVAKLIATLASLVWNYLFYSRFVFKDKA